MTDDIKAETTPCKKINFVQNAWIQRAIANHIIPTFLFFYESFSMKS